MLEGKEEKGLWEIQKESRSFPETKGRIKDITGTGIGKGQYRETVDRRKGRSDGGFGER